MIDTEKARAALEAVHDQLVMVLRTICTDQKDGKVYNYCRAFSLVYMAEKFGLTLPVVLADPSEVE